MQHRILGRSGIAGRAIAIVTLVVLAAVIAGAWSKPQPRSETVVTATDHLGRRLLETDVDRDVSGSSAVTPEAPGDGLRESTSPAQLGTLLGFLLVIAGVLIHWSRDTSCNAERSVFL